MQIAFISRQLSGYASLDTNIRQLEILSTASGPVLFAATGNGGGLTAWRLSATGVDPRLSDWEYYSSSLSVMGQMPISTLTINNIEQVIVGTNLYGALLAYSANANQTIGSLSTMSLTGGSGPQMSTASLQTGSTALFFAADSDTGALHSYRVNANGSFTLADTEASSTGSAGIGPILLETATVAGSNYLLRADSALQGVALYRVAADGALTAGVSVTAADGLGVNTPTTLATVTAYGDTFVLLGAAETSSISVLRLRASGTFELTDHLLDSLDTRFDGITAMETLVVDGRPFIIAGGADDGLTLFTLLPDGRLVFVQTLAQELGYGLENIQSIAAEAVGDEIQIYVASGGDSGISRLAIDLSQQGVTINGAGTGNNRIDGSALDDLLIANSSGSDTIYGGDGDDILVSGSGKSYLYGGRGNDVFVMRPDSERQYIMDFQSGDRVDLSGLPMLRSTAQLTAVPTETGILISYLDFEIEIVARNGRPLSLADVFPGLDLLAPDRVMILSNFPGDYISGTTAAELLDGTLGGDTIIGSAGNDTINGKEADDFIDGGTGDDHLFGNEGNDTIYGRTGNDYIEGGDGADTLNGAAGRDTLIGGEGNDYLSAGNDDDILYGQNGNDRIHGGAGVDLIYGGAGNDNLNGDGDNDSIEGGPGNDRLNGAWGDDILIDDAGNDTHSGGDGNDWISDGSGLNMINGGGGADTILGGVGDDTLVGGPDDYASGDLGDYIEGNAGNDRIWGGYGNDTARGGDGDDAIRGDSGNDLLYGDAGNDLLDGGAGSDTISGDAGNDRIYGGSGDDWLTGGTGADRFFSDGTVLSGTDYILDYTRSDKLVFTNSSATAAQFDVSFAALDGVGSALEDAVVTYTPTGQVVFVLADVDPSDSIYMQIDSYTFDLLA